MIIVRNYLLILQRNFGVFRVVLYTQDNNKNIKSRGQKDLCHLTFDIKIDNEENILYRNCIACHSMWGADLMR